MRCQSAAGQYIGPPPGEETAVTTVFYLVRDDKL